MEMWKKWGRSFDITIQALDKNQCCIEKYIAVKRNELTAFHKKWGIYGIVYPIVPFKVGPLACAALNIMYFYITISGLYITRVTDVSV